jgi:hypothetical protein
MLILRFMSANEAIRLLDGDRLHNDTHHGAAGQRTTSIGFCFAIGPTTDIETAIYLVSKNLSGIGVMDVCLSALLPDELPPGYETTTGYYKIGETKEICTTDYSLADFDDWRMYTPQLPPTAQPFKVIGSMHWRKPILTRSRKA